MCREYGEEIRDTPQNGGEEHGGHDHRVVAIRGACNEIPSQAGHAENRFDEDRARGDIGDLGAQHRDERYECIFQHVAHDDCPLTQTLCPAVRT